jgi:glycosyltransferase involved in cell wall biosynthesis
VLWRHDREPCTGRECLRCVLHYHRPPPAWRWTGLLERELHHVDEFVALSEFSRAKHQEFGFPRPMSVIPDFLPERAPVAAAAAGATGRPPHARPYVLYVGRLERITGLDAVVPAFAAATDAGVPDLVIAGDGSHREALERLAADSPRVRFLGRVSQAELAAWYAHAVAAVVPTEGFETFGLVVIEAFRAGTPVLARRMGPLPELVDASAGGGVLFDDAAGLLAHARRLAGDPVARADAAVAALAAFHAHWREDVVMPRYLALVERAVERRRAAPGVAAKAGAYAAPIAAAGAGVAR